MHLPQMAFTLKFRRLSAVPVISCLKQKNGTLSRNKKQLMSTPIILLKEIRKSYFMGKQALEVLKGVSLNINKNEYVALMGPSGSGKSTLMNILGCLDSPTLGTYILNGQDVSKMVDNDLAEVRNKEIG